MTDTITRNGSSSSTNTDAPSEEIQHTELKTQPSRTNAIAIRTINAIDQSTRYMLKREGTSDNELLNLAHGPIHTGLWIILIFFVFFGGWAAFAPLESAAICEGVVVVGGNHKTIQHLEGGVVEKIFVSEGQTVKKGQPLVLLNQTSAKARTQLLVQQLLAAQAQEARLIAERDNKKTINFGPNVEKYRNHADIAQAVDSQTRIFKSHQDELHGQIGVLEQRIQQLNDEIRGLSAQEKSALTQIELTRQEIDVVEKLLAQGNANKPRLLSLQRSEAELVGTRGQYLSSISKARQGITEAQIEIQNQRTTQMNQTMVDLRDTQSKIGDLVEQIRSSSDVLARVNINAPEDGIVTGLKIHTEGGVVKPGETIMDLVPTDDQMVVEARVAITDIDVVHKGLQARVMLSAYKTRHMPKIRGEVTYVSADRFTEEQTGKPYYKAKVLLNADVMKRLAKAKIEMYPGMPAQVFIVTESHTFLDYLLDPITESFNRAFREY